MLHNNSLVDLHVRTSAAPVVRTRSVRSLKNRLQARFPQVGSAHLTEAIAAAFAFKTNAAMRAANLPERLAVECFDHARFIERLRCDYELSPDLRPGPIAPLPMPDDEVRSIQAAMRAVPLVGGPPEERLRNQVMLGTLGRKASAAIAQRLDLGEPYDVPSPELYAHGSWTSGADHKSCLPNWGTDTSPSADDSFWRSLPGSRFRRSLPLPGGESVKYISEIITPSAVGHAFARVEQDLALQVGLRGWTCTRMDGWDFDGPVRHLLRRSTPHHEMLALWERSFKRWAHVHEVRLRRDAETDVTHRRTLVVEHVLECPHLPLAIRSRDEFEEHYLSEIRFASYWKSQTAQVPTLLALLGQWAREQQGWSVAG